MSHCNTLLLMLALIWFPHASTAHYVELQGELVQARTFTFGIALTGRPFAYRRDGELKGFEIAMARGVAQAHGLELRVVQLPRTQLANALASGEVDVINTFALDDRAPEIITAPYLVVGDHLMVLKGNPFRIRTTADLTGRTVAVTAGSTAERFARAINRNLADTGQPLMNIHSFPDQRYTHVPVSIGHAVAYFVQTVSAVGVTQDPDARERLVEGTFQPLREVGFGVRIGSDNIWHAVEHAVAAMVATGKYERLRKDYRLPTDLSAYR